MRALLVLLSLVAGLFAVEGTLAVLAYPKEVPLPAAHRPGLSWDHRSVEFAYAFRTNARGLRYPDVPAEKPSGETRVLVLGDSFVEGMGVEARDTFAARLERRFSSDGRRTRFINGGLQNSGPRQYARLLRHVGLDYRPDRVLVVVYANDVYDTAAADPARLGEEPWLDAEFEALRRTRAGEVFHRLWPRAWTLARASVRRLGEAASSRDIVRSAERRARRLGVSEERIAAWRASLPPDLVRATNRKLLNPTILPGGLLAPRYWKTGLDLSTEEDRRKWRTMTFYLDAIVRLARRGGAEVGLVHAPCAFQYDPAFGGLARATGMETDPAWLQGTAFETELGRWAASRGVPYLNLAPRFRAEALARPDALQYPLDGHWTPAGHAVAASEIAAWIEKGGFPLR